MSQEKEGTSNSLPFNQPTTSSISARIRAHRKARSLTLNDIERLSNGSIKAVVMGSYERGSRAISLARTIEIATLFAIPLSDLIEERVIPFSNFSDPMFFDLRKLKELSTKAEQRIYPQICKINDLLTAICARRRDWNGEVLTLRSSDFDTLTLILAMPSSTVKAFVSEEGLLIKATNHL
jgi:transcriptional regulator with XRE-family HTH domain